MGSTTTLLSVTHVAPITGMPALTPDDSYKPTGANDDLDVPTVALLQASPSCRTCPAVGSWPSCNLAARARRRRSRWLRPWLSPKRHDSESRPWRHTQGCYDPDESSRTRWRCMMLLSTTLPQGAPAPRGSISGRRHPCRPCRPGPAGPWPGFGPGPEGSHATPGPMGLGEKRGRHRLGA